MHFRPRSLVLCYPKSSLSSISWSYSGDGDSFSFSTNVWEEIKASEAGATGASSNWSDWAQSFVEIARDKANLGDYNLQAIYVVEVTEDNVAEALMQAEQYPDEKRDVLILDRK